MKKILILISFTLLALGTLHAQNPFEDAVKQLSSDNVKGYLQPFINGFGANLNSGLLQSSEMGDDGFHFQLKFVGMGTLIGDAEKMYEALPPAPFAQTPVQTATVFGDLGSTVTGPGGIQYQFQNGQVKASIIPFAVPQVTVGNFYGTEAVLRYVPIPEIGDFPKTTLFAIGARHKISRYFENSPVGLAAGLYYQSLTVGDIIDTKAFALNAQVSKSYSVFTLYGGVQYETSTMTITYTYTGPGSTPNSNVSLDLEGEGKFRASAGLGINLPVLSLNADISVGKVTVVSGGVGFGF